jgi:hypothetical protein
MARPRSFRPFILPAFLIISSALLDAAETPATGSASGGQRPSPWGFTSSAEWFGEYPRFNPLMATAGARFLRAFPEWSTLEPRKGERSWGPADALVANARSTGIELCGGFWYFAPWATPRGDTRSCPLKDISDWSRYVGAAVARYKNDIHVWEVYNEFNGSFSTSADKPKDYADLVAAAYGAAKAADPAARVGISCANFDLGFFDGALKAGAAGKFDFVCVHPYENLGSLATGGEDGFLSMAGSMRKLLADNHQRPDIGLWITEFGLQSTVAPDPAKDALQAEILVKGYLLALAQGFERVCWFEARGPSYGHGTDFGVIRQDWTLRPSYQALSTMTGLLGPTPTYRGWLNLQDGGYGFIFQGPSGAVLVAWSSKDPKRSLTFTTPVTMTDLSGVHTALPAGQALTLGKAPVYVSGLPADLVAQAAANAGKPFPWGGDFAAVAEVSCQLAATNREHGISQTNPQTTVAVNLLDHSLRRSNRAGGGEGIYAYFRVDPLFASFGTTALEITVVACRASDKAAGMDVCYESLKGYHGTGKRWEVQPGEEWQEHTWTVDNANFVGGWGWNFRTDIGGSAGDVFIKEVRVRKVGSTAAPSPADK